MPSSTITTANCSLEAPMLNHLQLLVHERYFPRSAPVFTLKTPSLSTISASNLDLLAAQLDWHSVTNVYTEGLHADDIGAILKLAPHLETRKFLGLFLSIGADDAGCGEIHIHESIKYLEIGLDCFQGFGYQEYHFLDSLSCPHLEGLSLNLQRSPGLNGCLNQKLAAFIVRSQCSITHFVLEDMQAAVLAYDKLIEILESLPTITNLRLTSMKHESASLGNIIFQHLSRSDSTSRTIFLPNLEELILEEWPTSNDIFQHLIDFLSISIRASDNNNTNSTPARSLKSNKLTSKSPSTIKSMRPIHAVQLALMTDALTPSNFPIIPFKFLSRFRRIRPANINGIRLNVTQRTHRNGAVHESDLIESSCVFYGAKP